MLDDPLARKGKLGGKAFLRFFRRRERESLRVRPQTSTYVLNPELEACTRKIFYLYLYLYSGVYKYTYILG